MSITKAQLESLPLTEIRAIAKEKGLKNITSTRKSQLIEQLTALTNESSETSEAVSDSAKTENRKQDAELAEKMENRKQGAELAENQENRKQDTELSGKRESRKRNPDLPENRIKDREHPAGQKDPESSEKAESQKNSESAEKAEDRRPKKTTERPGKAENLKTGKEDTEKTENQRDGKEAPEKTGDLKDGKEAPEKIGDLKDGKEAPEKTGDLRDGKEAPEKTENPKGGNDISENRSHPQEKAETSASESTALKKTQPERRNRTADNKTVENRTPENRTSENRTSENRTSENRTGESRTAANNRSRNRENQAPTRERAAVKTEATGKTPVAAKPEISGPVSAATTASVSSDPRRREGMQEGRNQRVMEGGNRYGMRREANPSRTYRPGEGNQTRIYRPGNRSDSSFRPAAESGTGRNVRTANEEGTFRNNRFSSEAAASQTVRSVRPEDTQNRADRMPQKYSAGNQEASLYRSHRTESEERTSLQEGTLYSVGENESRDQEVSASGVMEPIGFPDDPSAAEDAARSSREAAFAAEMNAASELYDKESLSDVRKNQGYPAENRAESSTGESAEGTGEEKLPQISSERRFESPRPDLSNLDSGMPAHGILEIMVEGYGFIRSENYMPGDNDVYVSPSQIRRFNMKTGDIVTGVKRIRTGNEKFAALLYVNEINGEKAGQAEKRPNFEDLTPIFPNERLHLETPGGQTAMRIVDLLSPIGKGQRGMIVSPPKAGKTTLLKQVAKAMTVNHPTMHLIILLIDERPEEVTDIKESIEGENVEVIYSTFDELPEHHKRVSEMVLERAKRLVEHGRDVMILLDSITRLARAYNLTVAPSGRTLSGGLDPAALHMPKRFFGAARNMREGGSLTILATALVDTGSRMDDVVYEEFKGTGNMELVLDRKLSERRIFPAIDILKSGTRRDDLLLTKEEQEATDIIRKATSGMKQEEVVEQVLDLFARTRSNWEFCQIVKKIRL